MTARCFLDTNVWIYAATGKVSEPRKFEIAREIIIHSDIAISAQVIGEFFRAVQKPRMKTPLNYQQTLGWVDKLAAFPCIDIDLNIARTAVNNVGLYKIQYFDAALLAQAERFGATIFYSEDLNDGQSYGSVRCENPFKTH